MKKEDYPMIDLVIGGPDIIAGKTTKVDSLISLFQRRGLVVRDIRGTEIDALYHSKIIQDELARTGWTNPPINFKNFLSKVQLNFNMGGTVNYRDFIWWAHELMSGGKTNQDLRVASMVANDVSTYIDPNSADVWIMEEPTKRGAGQVNRVIEQNRSKWGSQMDPVAAAHCHAVYRIDEFLRFRKPLRENGKITIRSRSEESACYQVREEEHLPNGIPKRDYLTLPGHKIAFANAPTHIFVTCGPESLDEKEYLKLREERSSGRFTDDHEENTSYQVLVNRRYASDWLERLYEAGCQMHGGTPPKIKRFSIYNSAEEIKVQMDACLEKMLSGERFDI